MDRIREILWAARDAGLVAGHFRGLLHTAIGRKITRPDGTVISVGVTWRELAAELKALRFDITLVAELGADPEVLAARDRERFWYSAIALAHVDSPEAFAEADKLAPKLAALGFIVSAGPAGATPTTSSPARARDKSKGKDDKSSAKKKK